jgi:hypothetical protein
LDLLFARLFAGPSNPKNRARITGHPLALRTVIGMPKIVRFHQVGGPEVLQLEELPAPQPGEGEVRIKVEAIGLNRGSEAVNTFTSRSSLRNLDTKPPVLSKRSVLG